MPHIAQESQNPDRVQQSSCSLHLLIVNAQMRQLIHIQPICSIQQPIWFDQDQILPKSLYLNQYCGQYSAQWLCFQLNFSLQFFILLFNYFQKNLRIQPKFIQELFLLIPDKLQTKTMADKVSKQQQGQQMFQITDQKNNPIGTQIFDPSLPSDLNFDQKKPKKQNQLEGVQVNSNYSYVKGKSKQNFGEQIKSYTIKGKSSFNQQPKYKCASIIKQHVNTFDVKAFDEQKSGGFKSWWQTIVGYVKRQLSIQGGYIYIFEKINQGYMTHAALKLTDLFKVFVDNQQSKIRFVFHFSKQNLKSKNFQVKNCQQIIQKVTEEASKIGLTVVSE